MEKFAVIVFFVLRKFCSKMVLIVDFISERYAQIISKGREIVKNF